jgi:hypothetical protein
MRASLNETTPPLESDQSESGERGGPDYLRLIHAIPGRLRVRWPALRTISPPEREKTRERCATHPGVEDVALRPLTGSVLVRYDHESLDTRSVLDLVRDATGARLVLGPSEPAPPRVSGDGEPTRLAVAAARFFEDVNQDVRRAFDGHADLSTLLPLSFLGFGLAEVVVTGEVPAPPWWNLCWWSFRAFHLLNEPAIEQAEEE